MATDTNNTPKDTKFETIKDGTSEIDAVSSTVNPESGKRDVDSTSGESAPPDEFDKFEVQESLYSALSVLSESQLKSRFETIKNAIQGQAPAAISEDTKKILKAIQEEVKSDLPESFKNAVQEVVNHRVATRINEERKRMATTAKKIVTERTTKANEKAEAMVKEATTILTKKVSEYLDYTTEKWLTENKLAVTSGAREMVLEQFYNTVTQGIRASGMNLNLTPSDKTKIASMNKLIEQKDAEVKAKVEELQSKAAEVSALNEAVIAAKSEAEKAKQETLDSKRKATAIAKEVIFNEETSSLSDFRKDKIRSMIVEMKFTGMDDFRRKVKVLVENTKPVAQPTKTNHPVVKSAPHQTIVESVNPLESLGNSDIWGS